MAVVEVGVALAVVVDGSVVAHDGVRDASAAVNDAVVVVVAAAGGDEGDVLLRGERD